MSRITYDAVQYGFGYVKLYNEIAIICAAVLLVMIFQSRRDRLGLQSSGVFDTALLFTAIFVLSDDIWFTMHEGFLPQSRAALMLLKSIYFLSTTLMCFFWAAYFVYRQNRDWHGWKSLSHRKRIVILLPLLLHAFLLLINVKTGWLFSSDADLVYHRGPAFPLQYILAYLYIVVLSITALFRSFQDRYYAERETFLSIAAFPVTPMICGIIQYFDWRFPCAGPGITISACILYTITLRTMVSRDPLTGLNNRRQMLRDISAALQADHQDGAVWLLMADIDKFKQINDTYGHLAGDEALCRASSILKKSIYMSGRRNVLARYGGDEFVILMPSAAAEDAELLKSQILAGLDAANKSGSAKYELSLSIGAACSRDTPSIRGLIETADENMYKEKQAHHQAVRR